MRATDVEGTGALLCAPTAGSQTLLVVVLAAAAWKAARALAAMPFDALRFQRAGLAKAGLVQNSMLASRDFERALGTLERLTLGPLARRV